MKSLLLIVMSLSQMAFAETRSFSGERAARLYTALLDAGAESLGSLGVVNIDTEKIACFGQVQLTASYKIHSCEITYGAHARLAVKDIFLAHNLDAALRQVEAHTEASLGKSLTEVDAVKVTRTLDEKGNEIFAAVVRTH